MADGQMDGSIHIHSHNTSCLSCGDLSVSESVKSCQGEGIGLFEHPNKTSWSKIVTEGDELWDISSRGVKMADRCMAAGRKSVCASLTNLFGFVKQEDSWQHAFPSVSTVNHSLFNAFKCTALYASKVVAERWICKWAAFKRKMTLQMKTLLRRRLINLSSGSFSSIFVSVSAAGHVASPSLQGERSKQNRVFFFDSVGGKWIYANEEKMPKAAVYDSLHPRIPLCNGTER